MTNQNEKERAETGKGVLRVPCALCYGSCEMKRIERPLTQLMHVAKAIKFQHSCAYIHLPLKSG